VDEAGAFIYGLGLKILGDYLQQLPGPARGNFTATLAEVEVETRNGPAPRVVAFVSQAGIPDELNRKLEAAGITVYKAASAPRGSAEGHSESAAANFRSNIKQQVNELGGRIINVRSAFTTTRICGRCATNLNKFIDDPNKSVRAGTHGMIEGTTIDPSRLQKVRTAYGLRGVTATGVAFRGFWNGMFGGRTGGGGAKYGRR
jgi:hypothetical protein